MVPSYIKIHQSGILEQRIEKAISILENCRLCPRHCDVNRLEGETGVCEAGRQAVVSSYNPHFGEEDPLVGKGGSGTIFMTHCNLRCVFCQNYEISHLSQGVPVGVD
ncbi:MAG: radical SAM protein, partial [Deltaproteobacteria bacterium]